MKRVAQRLKEMSEVDMTNSDFFVWGNTAVSVNSVKKMYPIQSGDVYLMIVEFLNGEDMTVAKGNSLEDLKYKLLSEIQNERN